MIQSKSSTLDLYLSIRQKTEELVHPLEIEDFVAQPVVDVSPPKWHLGHTTWFFENFILSKHLTNYQLFDESFAFIFNSYYESQGERILRNKRGTLTRPSTEKIFEYRKYVDLHISKLFEEGFDQNSQGMMFLEIGMNHEQQHQELLVTDIKYILGSNPLMPSYYKQDNKQTETVKLDWLTVKGGNYEIGYNGNAFHFDNEKGVHQVYLHDFQLMNRLVTNGEYIEFINDGGYNKAELWLMEGWEWVKQNRARAPFYWFLSNKEWHHYKLSGVQKVDTNETLTHINFYEAEAYARWKEMRLLTEQEWEVAANIYGDKNKAHFLDEKNYHPKVAIGNQIIGTAWEWTNSAYLPYPFYRQEKGALGEYNGKFMINQMVLRGGSCATPKSHFRVSYRNFFHPHLQWQFTGIRLAKNI